MLNFKIGSTARMTQVGEGYTIFKVVESPHHGEELSISIDRTKEFDVPAGTVVKFISVKWVDPKPEGARQYKVAEIIAGCKRGLGYAVVMTKQDYLDEKFVPYSTVNILGNFPRKRGGK